MKLDRIRPAVHTLLACGLAWIALTVLTANLRFAQADGSTGPDLVITGIDVQTGSAQQAVVLVTVTNQGVSPTLGTDGTDWFGSDLYVKPVGDLPPAGPGDRYLGACPTITNFCPDTIRWDLYHAGAGLNPGESRVLTYTHTFTAPGTYWLYAQADVFWGESGDPSAAFGSSASGRITEDSDINNVFGPYTVSVESRVWLPTMAKEHDPVPPPFAIQMYGSITTTRGFTYLVEAGAVWIRFPILWDGIEPVNTTPDNYNWAALDSSVQTAVLSNVNVIATIERNPAWAAARIDGPVTDTADLQEFVGAVVARYPQISYWELYNEPDSKFRFGLLGSSYADMLKAVYPAIKSANPQAKVVLGGLGLDWFTDVGGPFDRDFLTNTLTACSGSACFDVANFHYYPFFRHVWEAYGHDIVGKAAFVRQVLADHGYSQPLINTEMGWPAGSQWGGPDLAARYVPKAYVRAFAAGLPTANWFALNDADFSSPGLISGTAIFEPRPAFTAYRTLTSLMLHARFVRSIPSAETGSVSIEGYQFTVPESPGTQRLDVYWYDCPGLYTLSMYVNDTPQDCATRAPLKIAAAQVAMIDYLGVELILTDAADGKADGFVTIPNGGVGTHPMYIDYAP